MDPADCSQPEGDQISRDAATLAVVLDLLTLPRMPARRSRDRQSALRLSSDLESHAARLREAAECPHGVPEAAILLAHGIELAREAIARGGSGRGAGWPMREHRGLRAAAAKVWGALRRSSYRDLAVPARMLLAELEVMSDRSPRPISNAISHADASRPPAASFSPAIYHRAAPGWWSFRWLPTRH